MIFKPFAELLLELFHDVELPDAVRAEVNMIPGAAGGEGMNEVAIVVQWPKDKRLLVNEVIVIDEDGRPVNLRVIRCELPGMRGRTFASNSPPNALRKAFDRARTNNAKDAGGVKGPNQNAASGLTRRLREV